MADDWEMSKECGPFAFFVLFFALNQRLLIITAHQLDTTCTRGQNVPSMNYVI